MVLVVQEDPLTSLHPLLLTQLGGQLVRHLDRVEHIPLVMVVEQVALVV
jgi:hypothetical protein